MKIVCADAVLQSGHAPQVEFTRTGMTTYPECPSRYTVIRKALESTDWARTVAPEPQDPSALGDVHTADYLDFLRLAGPLATADSGGDLAASVYARPGGRPPAHVAGRAGYYGFDTTPIVEGTWSAAWSATEAALTAADLVLAGEQTAYALCRPPGHHAGPATFGGYCYLNHAALAATRLGRLGRVAILDIDYHHGNGTQQVFWENPDVLFVSLHADPAWEYPLYWGYAEEVGAGPGTGMTLNRPLPAGVDDDRYIGELTAALAAVTEFAPASLVVSVGFDGYGNDPLGRFDLSLSGFERIGATIAAHQLPTVLVQEGGYCVDALGDLAQAFLAPFAAAKTAPVLTT